MGQAARGVVAFDVALVGIEVFVDVEDGAVVGVVQDVIRLVVEP